VLLYTPCISALTVARHELGTKWMALSAVGQFVIAWLAGAFVFQVGALL
jgi:ferrous iron transport protein B